MNIKHSANAGDLIASLSGIKAQGKKATIYQALDVPAGYYQGATHPTTTDGIMVMMNKKIFDMIKPLVEAQDYIESLQEYRGQVINVNLDKIRGEVFCGMPNFPIQRWISYVYPQLQSDVSKAWLKVERVDLGLKDTIIINRTFRYQNPNLNYFFLKDYNCVFIGVEQERLEFNKKWGLSLPHYEVRDFYHLAQALMDCKFFIGNQSMAYNIAEGLKSKRILELCQYAPNCFVTGENGREFLHQHALEQYVKEWS